VKALIDDWLPRFDEHEFHSKEIAASPAEVERAVRALKPDDLPLTRLLLALRTLPALVSGRRRPDIPSRPLLEGVLSLGFVVLDERPGEQVVLGAAGRFWRPRGDGVDRLGDPQEFRDYDRPASVRAAWDFVLTPTAGGGTRLSTETRIAGTDADGTRVFRRYWRLVYPGSALIRLDILRAVARRAAA
jgi:hypothetical protein